MPKESKLNSPADVDQPGIRVGVNVASAYDLFLTRSLKHATLVRSEDGAETFLKEKLEAAGGVKQALQKFIAANPGVRLIDQRFMEIRQAMGTAKGKTAGAAYLRGFIEEMKKKRLRRRRAEAFGPGRRDGRAAGLNRHPADGCGKKIEEQPHAKYFFSQDRWPSTVRGRRGLS